MTKRTNALWFFVALLGGGAAIWWTKSAVDNAWFAAMVAAGVVLALIIYYLLNDEDAPEEEGDNVYYLGLLFTLISLMFTLVELFGADAVQVRNPEKIRALLKNFGIALTSTVVGIAGRVALLNWQRLGSAGTPDLVDNTAGPAPPPPGASAEDLDGFNRHVLGRIARDLTQGANALARFHRIVRSHASESEDYLRNHSEVLKRESSEFKDTLQRNADTFAQELKNQAESTLQDVGGSLGAVAQQAEALVERLQSAHDGYLAELRETTRSFHDDIQSASGQNLDALRQNFDAAAQQAEALPERLRSAHDGYLAELRETTRSFHDDIQSASGQNLSTVNERIDKAFDNLESGLGHASRASEALGNRANQAAKSIAVLEVQAESLRVALAPLHAGAEAMTGMLDSMKELDAHMRAGRDTEQTTAAVRQIGEMLQTITAEAEAATERAASAAELLDAITRSVQTTEGETRRAAKALGDLASAAEARAETLHQNQKSGFGFWNRRQ